jgi:multiple sugar transport system ATP-binding protein
LFDEPLSNLDAKLRAELRLEIKKLHKTLKSTMIYVTHDQIEALTLADRIAVMKDGIIQQLDSPHNVYNRPANLFVATFLGSPAMNCLDGVLNVNDSTIEFVAGDMVIDVTEYDFSQSIEDGQAVTLGIRPEHIAMSDTLSICRNQQAGTIELVEPMGSDSLLWSRFGSGHQLSHRTNSDEQFKAGNEVTISIDPKKCSLFDTQTTQRI